MKNTIRWEQIAALFIVVLLTGCGRHQSATVHWEYKTMAFSDDWPTMQKYLFQTQATNGASTTDNLNEYEMEEKTQGGRFAELDVNPGSEWELVSYFLEPNPDHPHLICIFKKPVTEK